MSTSAHIGKICSKSFYGLFEIRQIRKVLRLPKLLSVHSSLGPLQFCSLWRPLLLISSSSYSNLTASYLRYTTCTGFQWFTVFGLNSYFLFTKLQIIKHLTICMMTLYTLRLTQFTACVPKTIIISQIREPKTWHLEIAPLFTLDLFFSNVLLK